MSVRTMRKSLFDQGADCDIVIVDILGIQCGLPARAVEAVIPLPEMIALPPCAYPLRGIISWQNDFLPIAEIIPRGKTGERITGKTLHLVIVSVDTITCGLMVNAVRELTSVCKELVCLYRASEKGSDFSYAGARVATSRRSCDILDPEKIIFGKE